MSASNEAAATGLQSVEVKRRHILPKALVVGLVAGLIASFFRMALQRCEFGRIDWIERLPPALSEVFHLRVSGLRYEEIADVLECPVGTIKSRMNQMVTQLREELRPWTVG